MMAEHRLKMLRTRFNRGHVRNVNGKCLSDEKMLEYYAGFVGQYIY